MMTTRPARHLLAALAAVLLTLLSVATAGAQATSTITGTVTDTSGAAVPNAVVTLTEPTTAASHTMRSDAAGLFSFPALVVGTYDIEVKAQGFKVYRKSGLVLNASETLGANVTLQVGTAAETVTVRANALQVESQSNEITTLLTGRQLVQIAINGRQPVELAALGTGVTTTLPSFDGIIAIAASSPITFNGLRQAHNVWLIDGAEAMDRGAGGDLIIDPSPDALSQFRVLSSNYPPDFGLGSGGTVAMVVKSGTRELHGGVWEFNRNDAFDAQAYFSKLAHIRTPELRLNIFGGNIGGPLYIPHIYNEKRNKTFFFLNLEWRRLIQGVNPHVVAAIPSEYIPTAGQPLAYKPLSHKPLTVPMTQDPAKLALYESDGLTAGQPFSQNAGGAYVIPANLIDPNAVLLMNSGAIPAGNLNNGTEYASAPKQPTSLHEVVVRIDHNINDKLRLMGHYISDFSSQTTIPPSLGGVNSYNTTGTIVGRTAYNGAIRLTQIINPSIINETSLNAGGNKLNGTPIGTYQEPAGWSASGLFSGNNALNRLPDITLSGAPNTTYSVNYWPWYNGYLEYQIRDDLSWIHGRHAMKYGFSYMRQAKDQLLQAPTQGAYTFSQSAYSGDAYGNLLLGFASSYHQLQDLSNRNWLSNDYSFYLMDNWHTTPRLTINLGLRYDAMPHTYEKSGNDSNFVPGSFIDTDSQVPSAQTGLLNPDGPGFEFVPGQSVPFYMNGIATAGAAGTPRGLVKNYYKGIQPRVGFAYDLTGRGTTVLRAGFGMFFERTQGNDSYNTALNPPFAYNPTVNAVYFSNPKISNQSGAVAAGQFFPGTLTGMSAYYPLPAVAEYSLGVQHQLAPSVIVKIQYVGNGGWHQNFKRAINTLPLVDPGNPANPFDNREAVAHGTNPNLFRIYPGWAGINMIENESNTGYNSLQAGLRMQSKHGFTAEFAYTWSHEIDIVSNDQAGVSNPFDPRYDRASGSIDRRNVFNVNYIYDLPFFMHSRNSLAHSLLGGWQLSGITVAESGSPFPAAYSPDVLGLGGGTSNRANLVSKVHYPKTQRAWFSTSSFAAPAAPWQGGPNEGFGASGRDALVGPGLFNWNMSLFKTIVLHEGIDLQLRAESFNTFNHTEFEGVSSSLTSSNFGQTTSTYDPRTWQFAGKLNF